MNKAEAKTLVNSTLKKYKLEKRRETIHLVGPIAGMLVGGNLIMSFISIPFGSITEIIVAHSSITVFSGILSGIYFLNEYDPDYELKEKIDILKQLKYELKNNVNRFENVDIANFNNELENQFKKTK